MAGDIRARLGMWRKWVRRDEEDKGTVAVDPSNVMDPDDARESSVELRPPGEATKSADPERRQDDGSAPELARVYHFPKKR
jgi:hypothetical protein